MAKELPDRAVPQSTPDRCVPRRSRQAHPRRGHADAAAISYLAMTIWACEELVHGVSWFRHLLGLAYVFSTAVHLALGLQH